MSPERVSLHYVATALRVAGDRTAIAAVAAALAEAYPAFDRAGFYDACGYAPFDPVEELRADLAPFLTPEALDAEIDRLNSLVFELGQPETVVA